MFYINIELIKKAINLAFDARLMSYAPYSHFKVGATIICKNHELYTGCNIENASFGATDCAERTAIFKAVSNGIKDFIGIVVVDGKEDKTEFENCTPCGICLQVMTEFCDLEEFNVILARSESDYKIFSLGQLLPLSFTNKNF